MKRLDVDKETGVCLNCEFISGAFKISLISMQERIAPEGQELLIPRGELRIQASNFIQEIKIALDNTPEFSREVLKNKAFSSLDDFWNLKGTKPIPTSEIRFKKNGASFLVFYFLQRTSRGINEYLVVERVTKTNGIDKESVSLRSSGARDSLWEPGIQYYRKGMNKGQHDTYEAAEKIKAFINSRLKARSQETELSIVQETAKRREPGLRGYASERDMWRDEWIKFRHSPLLESYLNDLNKTYIRTLDDFFGGRISTVGTISPALDSFTMFVVNHLSAA